MPHRVCYAVKANGNLAILRLLADAGAGFDIVSGGELFRVLKAGADPAVVIFSGVGKTAARARLRAGTSDPKFQLRVGTGIGAARFAGGSARRAGAEWRCE